MAKGIPIDGLAQTGNHFLWAEVVVELLQTQMAEVAKPIPLSSSLRIHVVKVVKNVWTQRVLLDGMFDRLSVERWLFWVCQSPA